MGGAHRAGAHVAGRRPALHRARARPASGDADVDRALGTSAVDRADRVAAPGRANPTGTARRRTPRACGHRDREPLTRHTEDRVSALAPGTQHFVNGHAGGLGLRPRHELSSLENAQRLLYATFREARSVGDVSQARSRPAAAWLVALRPKVEIDEQRRRPLVMPDEIGHERVDDVAIEAELVHGGALSSRAASEGSAFPRALGY